MDDFSISSLHESKNEWGARLLTILTPLIIDGYKSIFNESLKLCKENNELDKYLMTFQNLISRVPKWNSNIIEKETQRIIDKSNCKYLEGLVTCIHIIQLKILTSMRVGQKQKKIEINIPKLDDFIHKVYINVARKLYKNVYLFELNVQPLQTQQYNRELEKIVQECILNAVRESIPVEEIIRAYMDENEDVEITETIEERIDNNVQVSKTIPETSHLITEQPSTIAKQLHHIADNTHLENNLHQNINNATTKSLKFNDIDYMVNNDNVTHEIDAPKTIERLEEISTLRNNQRKLDELDESDDNVLIISNDDINLNNLDVHELDEPKIKLDTSFLLDDIEILA